MKSATDRVTVGLSGGTAHVLRSAREVLSFDEGAVLYHTDLRPRNVGRPISYGRMLSSIHDRLRVAHSSFLDDDELVGWFYKGFQGYRPFRREDSMSFDLKSASLHSESRLVKRLRPNLVSVGGDWLDFLGAIGRTDLIVEGMSRWRSWCDSWGGSLLLTTYTGSLTLEGALEKVLPMLDGLLVTVNRSGNGMFPTRQAFLDWVVGCKKPIMAMHAMEIGRIPVTEALRYIFEESPACSAVLGASRPATILQLCEGLADQFST